MFQKTELHSIRIYINTQTVKVSLVVLFFSVACFSQAIWLIICIAVLLIILTGIFTVIYCCCKLKKRSKKNEEINSVVPDSSMAPTSKNGEQPNNQSSSK